MRFFFPVFLFIFSIVSCSEYPKKSLEESFPGRPARDESSYVDMPVHVEAIGGRLERIASSHVSHDVSKVMQTISETPQETRITIIKDNLHESDHDKRYVQVQKRTLWLSHGAVSLITGLIMGGITLAVKYGSCK